jgi:phenylalanyl-tRNA synthetase beta chain
MNAKELFDVLRQDLKLKPYLGIIEKEPRYPVFYDEDRKVLSLPPIINSEATKITPETKNCFIEITATDHTRARTALAILVSQFSEYCSEPFTVEPVKIVQPDGSENITPELLSNEFDVSLEYCNRLLGVKIPMADIPKLLPKMGLEPLEVGETDFKVRVPPTRSDILHACDVAEDIGIAFGFNNIPREVPATLTVGSLLSINKFSDLLRSELAQAGYTEILTSGLISKKEIFDHLRVPFQEHAAVHLANSKTKEYDYVRTTLIPGVLKTIHANKAEKLPHKIFEVADVC